MKAPDPLESALRYLDADRGGPAERARLREDPALRPGWMRFQALRQLAQATEPAATEADLKGCLARCRGEWVAQRLAATAGGDALARELLLDEPTAGRRSWGWLVGLGLLAAAGAAWWTLSRRGPAGRPSVPTETSGPDAVPFEFPVQTPPRDAALAGPGDADGSGFDADDVHGESAPAAEARRLMRQQLSGPAPAARPQGAGGARTADALAAPRRRPSPGPVQASPSARTWAPDLALSGTGSAPAAPAPLPPAAAVPSRPVSLVGTVIPLSLPKARAAASRPLKAARLRLSSRVLAAEPTNGPAGRLIVTLNLPQRRDVDIRLFGPNGRSVRVLASGPLGPGRVRLPLTARDRLGRALDPGTYYLRVMTAWFSRVETLQIR